MAPAFLDSMAISVFVVYGLMILTASVDATCENPNRGQRLATRPKCRAHHRDSVFVVKMKRNFQLPVTRNATTEGRMSSPSTTWDHRLTEADPTLRESERDR